MRARFHRVSPGGVASIGPMQHASFQIEHESDRPLAMFAASSCARLETHFLCRSRALMRIRAFSHGGCRTAAVWNGADASNAYRRLSHLSIDDHSASAPATVGAYASFFRFLARTCKRSVVRRPTLSPHSSKAAAAGRGSIFFDLFHTCSVRRYDHALGIATSNGVSFRNGNHHVYCSPLEGANPYG